jgi:hypothetical protein
VASPRAEGQLAVRLDQGGTVPAGVDAQGLVELLDGLLEPPGADQRGPEGREVPAVARVRADPQPGQLDDLVGRDAGTGSQGAGTGRERRRNRVAGPAEPLPQDGASATIAFAVAGMELQCRVVVPRECDRLAAQVGPAGEVARRVIPAPSQALELALAALWAGEAGRQFGAAIEIGEGVLVPAQPLAGQAAAQVVPAVAGLDLDRPAIGDLRLLGRAGL